MKPAERFNGVVHDRVECPHMGSAFDVVVIGPDDREDDDVSMQTSGQAVSMSFRFSRSQAKRIGELLILAADDVGGKGDGS